MGMGPVALVEMESERKNKEFGEKSNENSDFGFCKDCLHAVFELLPGGSCRYESGSSCRYLET